MTDNMLFLARAEHADHAIELGELVIGDELRRIAEYFEGLAEERGIAVRYCDAPRGTLWADPMLLRRALANLLANAVRHAEPGSDIVLRAQPDADGGILLAVENRGVTIPPHQLARLFDRFYRTDAARLGSSESSGLGLSIVRSIMTLHQGRWGATSAGGLTRFTLYFPAPAKPAA